MVEIWTEFEGFEGYGAEGEDLLLADFGWVLDGEEAFGKGGGGEG